MAPIRIGLIGLSAGANTWAALAHLPYLATSKHYTITALLNSSVDSAKAAIKEHKLPASTKAHATPRDLAADPDVDLVVCSVHVSKHYETVKPSLEAGKNVLVEWPLGATTEQAEDLARIAAEKKVKLEVVNLQGRFSPSVLKVQQLVDAGRIGRVLSSSYTGAASNFGGTEVKRLRGYVTDANTGGDMLTIHFAHAINYVEKVLGPLKQITGKIGLQRPESKILDGETVIETVTRHTPDHVLMQGTFQSGALISFQMRGGNPFPGTPGLVWRIYGETGEINVTSPGIALNIDYRDKVKIEVHDHATNKVEEIAIEKDELSGLPQTAQNVARTYEAIVEGKNGTTFNEAINLHKLLDSLRKSSAEDISVAR